MKKIIYALFLTLFFLNAFNQCPPDAALLLNLKFSGNEADSSVYNHPILSIGGAV